MLFFMCYRPFSYWNWNVAILFNWVIGLTYAGFCGGAVSPALRKLSRVCSHKDCQNVYFESYFKSQLYTSSDQKNKYPESKKG